MVRSEITYSIDSAYHMLRHFEGIPVALEKQLLSKGYSRTEMEDSLHAPGSRFAFQFANSIDELLDRLFNQSSYTMRAGINDNLLIHALVSKDKFKTAVGTCGVVSIDSLDESQRTRIYRKKNREVDLWHLDVEELPTTSEYTIILKPANQHFIFITAFPGPPAMPLPDRKMTKELYEKCRLYWDLHVFLQ